MPRAAVNAFFESLRVTSWQALSIAVVLSATKDKLNSAAAVGLECRWEPGDTEGTRGGGQKGNNWNN